MHTVETDYSKNLIIVKVENYLSAEEAIVVIQEIFREIETFGGKGFSMLLDFSSAEVFPQEVTEMWVDVAARARMLGLVKSARLLSSNALQKQVNGVARRAENLDLVENFTDLQQALDWLTSTRKRRLIG